VGGTDHASARRAQHGQRFLGFQLDINIFEDFTARNAHASIGTFDEVVAWLARQHSSCGIYNVVFVILTSSLYQVLSAICLPVLPCFHPATVMKAAFTLKAEALAGNDKSFVVPAD
jgi:hypothetical protein